MNIGINGAIRGCSVCCVTPRHVRLAFNSMCCFNNIYHIGLNFFFLFAG